jgi:hypothetical protein
LINTINDLVNKLYVRVKNKVARKYIKRGLERIMWKSLDSRVRIKTEKRIANIQCLREQGFGRGWMAEGNAEGNAIAIC